MDNAIFDKLVETVKKLNEDIRKDLPLGEGFEIGHSYLCVDRWKKEKCTNAWMKSVVEYEIIPLLSEYWFDNEDQLKKWKGILEQVVS